jgi:hypothetical protein
VAEGQCSRSTNRRAEALAGITGFLARAPQATAVRALFDDYAMGH